VAIAGALASRPECIVFDEPTSMLDPRGRREILDATMRLNVEHAITVVLITHAMEEAALARRVVVMDGGRVALDGPPAQVFERSAELEALGLELPPALQMARMLQARGVQLPSGLLTAEQLVAALC